MEIGLIFAVLTALGIGVSASSTRRGVFFSGESFTPVVINVFFGTILFACLTSFTGDWDKLWTLSWQGLVLLITAGIIHFIVGRFLNYTCMRLIGATRSAAIFRTQMFYAVFLGILLFEEPLTAFLVTGVLCILAGATLAGTQKGDELARVRGIGVLAGFGGAFFFGISSVLIKPAVVEIGSPFAAGFVSFSSALVVAVFLLLGKEQRRKFLPNSSVILPKKWRKKQTTNMTEKRSPISWHQSKKINKDLWKPTCGWGLVSLRDTSAKGCCSRT